MKVSASVFGPSGLLSKKFPGYQPRRGQLAMVDACETAYSTKGSRYVVEAPTGVGKSIAYLAPILASGKRAVVATANIALSEQIVTKDFPKLAEAMGVKATVALAKGLANYACKEKLENLEDSSEELDRVARWAEKSKTGDLSELPFVPSTRSLPLVTSTAEDCLKSACSHFETCFGLEARRRAQTAQVVVTNYHLLFSHLEVAKETESGESGILPKTPILVLDEAHNAADIARGFVGTRVTEFAIKRALRPLSPPQGRDSRPALDEKLFKRATYAAASLFSLLGQDKPGRIKKAGRLGFEIEGFLADLWKAAAVYGKTIRDATDLSVTDSALFGDSTPSALRKWYAGKVSKDEKRLKAWIERLRISGRSCLRYGHAIKKAQDLADPNFVHFTEFSERGSVALCSAPIAVAPYLRELVWGPESGFDAVVATSATLRDGGDSFELVLDQQGAWDATTLAVESPFDFSRCLLVCDADWPEPKEPSFGKHISETLERTIRLADGRTLGLFASHRSLKAAAEAIRWKNAGGFLPKGIEVFVQGDAPRTELVRRFRENERSVLLGTRSFWEGVDVPGRALSALWIEKLPFATPDDPIFDAIQEQLGRQAFSKYSLPLAVIAFRQGFGRLIRSMGDAGIVVVADPRIFTANYGPRFTGVLPSAVAGGDWAAAEEHLREYLQ